MKRVITLAVALVFASGGASSVSAKRWKAKTGVVTGVKAGVALPQPFSTLKTSPATELEVGYLLPFLGRRLGVFVTLGYAVAQAQGEGEDARLAGGVYQWEIAQQELMLSFGVSGRIFPPYQKLLNGYLIVGPRLFFLRTIERAGAGDEPFGRTSETGLRVGVFATLGGEIYLGPGAAFLEFELGWTELTGTLTGKANGGALRFALGYRLIL